MNQNSIFDFDNDEFGPLVDLHQTEPGSARVVAIDRFRELWSGVPPTGASKIVLDYIRPRPHEFVVTNIDGLVALDLCATEAASYTAAGLVLGGFEKVACFSGTVVLDLSAGEVLVTSNRWRRKDCRKSRFRL
jgi:hypothetical protein